jgi:hypothetical protein
MRQRTAIETVTHRGEVRLEIDTVRSNLTPQWSELRRLYRWWRLQKSVQNDRKSLSTETQAALYWAEEALERELLFRDN